ncbi:MAG: T9SS type A sorting domain-containing protein [Cryomorphaceae bacterium]|nr:T9SS type A sorting domain-containing protein [Cryomorphaceae bacterium]
MIRIYTVLVALFLAWNPIEAQTCCPYINSVSLSPATPTPGNPVSVIVDVTTPSLGNVVSFNHNISGGTIHLVGCYHGGMLPALQNFVDTINLGVLPQGNYTLNFSARMSSDPNTCIPVDSTHHTQTFTVGTPPPPPTLPCCIQIDSAGISPSSPINDTTPLSLLALVSLPANGQLFQDALSIVGNDIVLETCYLTDSTAAAMQVTDTFAIGLLPHGTYNLNMIAHHSLDPASCVPVDTAVYSLTFTVDSTHQQTNSINEIHAESISIFPNPAKDQISVSGLPDGDNYIQIFSLTGNCIYEKKHLGSQLDINTTKWRNGIYLVKVNEVRTYKIIINK